MSIVVDVCVYVCVYMCVSVDLYSLYVYTCMHQPWNCPHGRPTMRHLTDLHALHSSPAPAPAPASTAGDTASAASGARARARSDRGAQSHIRPLVRLPYRLRYMHSQCSGGGSDGT